MDNEKEKKYLAEWRIAKRWSPSELQRQSGVNRSVIKRIEDGDQTGRFDTAVKLAAALGIEPEQILDFAKLFEVKKENRQLLMMANTTLAV